MPKKIIYTISFFCCAFFCNAQNQGNIILSQINEDNGLSDNHTTCVLKDKQGLVWVGTQDGLNLLDGSSLKNFKHRDADSFSISTNFIYDIKEDEDGNIWIATSDGLNCYNKKVQHFFNYTLVASPYSSTALIFSIAIDKKNIWCGTDGGLIKFNASDKSSLLFECGQTEILNRRRSCNKINYLLLDENKICWLCTGEGFWSFNTTNGQFKKEISAENDPFYHPLFLTVSEESGDKLWVGNWSYGLKLFDKRTGQITNYNKQSGSQSHINSITKILLPGGKHILWLNGAMQAFDPATATFFQYKKPLLLPDYPMVKANYVSPDNWVWMMSDKGLYIYNPQRQVFNTQVFNTALTSQSMVLNQVDNNIILGGQSSSLFRVLDNSLDEINNYSNSFFTAKPHKRISTAALSLVKRDNNSWWMGTTEGIVHFNNPAGPKKWFEHIEKDTFSLPKNFINHLFFDHEKKLWIFPWREGIWQMDTATGRCKQILDGLSLNAGVRKKLVIADVAEDAEGNIWMCDLDEGIILYERKANRFSKPFAAQIGSAVHTAKIYWRNGYFYSIADNTIIKWKDKSNCIKINFPPEIEKQVYDFTPDLQGNWWFVTKNGLTCFNEGKNIFTRFTTADGLYSNDLDATIYCTSNGNIVIAAPLFLTVFDAKKILEAPQTLPAMLLTNFAANGNHVNYSSGKAVHLAYNSSNLSFEWALPDYTNPFRNQYYYRLEGIDTGWRYAGNKGAVQFANLTAGSYTILLKAANANGDFTKEHISIHFIIHPPFWKTAWFIIGCLLLTGIFIYWLFKRRLKAVKKKAAVQQQMSELEMKALRAQMNPHFIFNSLNSIQECIVMNNTGAAYEYLSKFSKLVRRILENSGKLFVPLNEEIELLQWYVELEQLRFKEPVDFSMTADASVDTHNISLPSMIIQPYIENALWHGLAYKEGDKKLSVHFMQKEHGINCVITDNGIGRQSSAALKTQTRSYKKSMGMMITKERLELFNKQAKVETVDLFTANNQAAGTKIIIYLPTE